MKTRFEVLSQSEVERICAASFGILAEVGIKCEYAKAQELFRQAGAQVDENSRAVRIPEHLGRWALENAPSSFSLYGNDPGFHIEIGGEIV
jgi:trimethylamine:corrinoid methyltransferase-like protein